MSSLLREVALVSEVQAVSTSELMRVAAALQQQATRDFGPVWGVNATVHAFTDLEDVPLDAWPMVIQTDIHEAGAAGIHLDQHGQPFALIQFDPGWSLTASHECLEMLADPFGNRLRAGPSPRPGQGRVRFLVEVCDPCESSKFAYTVNGITVSDFITPRYYDPHAAPGVQYSFTGAIKQPREVLVDGYLSWLDPQSGHWFQLTMFDGHQHFVNLGAMDRQGRSLREAIDSATPSPLMARPAGGRSALMAAVARQDTAEDATRARARNLRDDIAAVKSAPPSRRTMFPNSQPP